jgi:hypothetical protein
MNIYEARGVATKGRIEFDYNGQNFKFPTASEISSFRQCYLEIYNWLIDKGYDFKNVKNVFNNNGEFYSEADVDRIIKSGKYQRRLFQKLKNSNKYLLVAGNKSQYEENLINMLNDFGAENINLSGFDPDTSDTQVIKYRDFTSSKMTFARAAQIVLQKNENRPMSSKEIWNQIESMGLIKTTGSTPWATLNVEMRRHSDNSNVGSKYSDILFHIISNNGGTDLFKLITNSDPESNSAKITKPGEVISKPRSKNPFIQSICVLGKSGKGKSTTVEKILDNFRDKMEYEFIIPTSSTTNLLTQYSPKDNDLIQSRLGRLIMKASKNPKKLFTAVFDECHKSNVIEMINDELLQCISLYRNQGKRFISLDDDSAKLYSGLDVDRSGNLLLPDNFGFIFLSSKPEIIVNNPDFFNRVDIYVLTKQPKGKEDISFSDTEYFTPVGNRENGSKSLEDIDRIKQLNDAD